MHLLANRYSGVLGFLAAASALTVSAAPPSTVGTNFNIAGTPTVAYFSVEDARARTPIAALREVYLMPEEAHIEVDELTGKPFIDFDSVEGADGSVRKIHVDVNIQTGWSRKTTELIRQTFGPATLQVLLRAKSSEFRSFRSEPISGLTLETLFGEREDVLAEPYLSEPFRLVVTGPALQSLACAMTAYRQLINKSDTLNDEAKQRVLAMNPLNFLVGKLTQTYDMQNVTVGQPNAPAEPTVIVRNLPTKIERPVLTPESPLDRMFFDAVSRYQLRCRLPLRPVPSHEEVRAPEVDLYGFDDVMQVIVQNRLQIDWRAL